MLTLSTTAARPLTRLALAALLALGTAAAHAQVVPKPAPPVGPAPKNVVYFVDGKLVTAAAMQAMDQTSIASINVLKDAADKKALGQASSDGVALITTQAGANSPEAQALNKRFPVTPATPEQNAAAEAAKAYLAQHYPKAKLESVGPAQGKAGRYTITFTNEGQRVYLLFDGQGQPVEN